MLKKLLFIVFLTAIVSCLPIFAQSGERTPALPKNLVSYDDQYPMDLFKKAAVKQRLHKLLGKSYNDFMDAIDSQSPMKKSGDLLVGQGCAKGLCTILEAMIVIELKSKAIHCGIFANADKTKYRQFSESPKNIPAVLTDWANALLKENK